LTFIILDPLIQGWIIRFFREATADISASYHTEEPLLSANLVLQAMEKFQKAIHLCLGDPNDIQELLYYKINSSNPFYDLLFPIQKIIQYWLQKILYFEIFNIEELRTDAKRIFNIARIFVINFSGDKIPSQIEIYPENS